MQYINKILAAPALVFLLLLIGVALTLWIGLGKVHRKLATPMSPPLNWLLIAFVAVLAFGSYRSAKLDYRTQFSLHGFAIMEKLRKIYPEAFEK